MKAIRTVNEVLVPYRNVVEIWKVKDDLYNFYSLLGRLHTCTDDEYIGYVIYLKDNTNP